MGMGSPGSDSARQRIRRAKLEKTYSVSRAWAGTGGLDVTRPLIESYQKFEPISLQR
jgi:hypothetical protein